MLYISFLDNYEEPSEMGGQTHLVSHRRYSITLPMPPTRSLQ